MTHLYKYENCPKCKAELTQSGYDGQWCKCGWSALGFKAANDEYLAYLEAAVRAAGFEIKHDGGALADSNFRIEPIIKHGMADQALAGEIVAAVLRDEQDGGCDLSAGMFGKSMTALIRRITSVYLAPAAPGIDLGPIRRLIEGVRDIEVKDSAKNANAGFVDQRCIGALRGIANDAERALDASPKSGGKEPVTHLYRVGPRNGHPHWTAWSEVTADYFEKLKTHEDGHYKVELAVAYEVPRG